MIQRSRKGMWNRFAILVGGVLFLMIYNEFLLYFFVIIQCRWPSLDPANADRSVPDQKTEPVRVMMLADTHILGTRNGHWFDQMRREWQMKRAYQTTLAIHKPDIVFVLGDALDEGKWSNDQDFRNYVKRFKDIFATSSDTDMHVVVGNHDIGFHYMIDDNKRKRFTSAFSSPSVQKLVIGGNIFVLLNSMAMEGDGCTMCNEAEIKLLEISTTLKCSQGEMDEVQCSDREKIPYSRPIILQHFPMFRESDSICSGPDEAPPEIKNQKFHEKMDCLSKDATEKLIDWLSPRFIVSAHTHFGCYNIHRTNIPEWTIPSFSWRNINQPAFILARISPNNYAVNKCLMPKETTLIYTYIVGVSLLTLWLLTPLKHLFIPRSLKTS